jgi:mono/diheme cytochrome c family protein
MLMKSFKTINILFQVGLLILVYSFFSFQPNPELKESMSRGEKIYNSVCVTCHMTDGKGVMFNFPPLSGSDYLLQKKELAIKAVKFGQEGEIVVNGETFNNVMPSNNLNDQQVMDVMNYILNTWGNNGGFINLEQVKKVKK